MLENTGTVCLALVTQIALLDEKTKQGVKIHDKKILIYSGSFSLRDCSLLKSYWDMVIKSYSDMINDVIPVAFHRGAPKTALGASGDKKKTGTGISKFER